MNEHYIIGGKSLNIGLTIKHEANQKFKISSQTTTTNGWHSDSTFMDIIIPNPKGI